MSNVGAGAVVFIIIGVLLACGGVGWWIKKYGGKAWAEAVNPPAAGGGVQAPPPPPGGASKAKQNKKRASGNPIWEAAYDEDGEAYWINKETGEPSWDPPPGHARVGTSGTEIPAGWTTAKDVDENKKYYINEESGEAQWDKPDV
jgi:hypothetical protein